jgi:hypothetical protein
MQTAQAAHVKQTLIKQPVKHETIFYISLPRIGTLHFVRTGDL